MNKRDLHLMQVNLIALVMMSIVPAAFLVPALGGQGLLISVVLGGAFLIWGMMNEDFREGYLQGVEEAFEED